VSRGNGGRDKHRSETELSDYQGWDGFIDNNGSLDALRKRALELAATLVGDSFSTKVGI
jgi:hypothetical protein